VLRLPKQLPFGVAGNRICERCKNNETPAGNSTAMTLDGFTVSKSEVNDASVHGDNGT
jgi:hypothetical protein